MASQVDLQGLFNTYVTRVFFSLFHALIPCQIIPRLQRVMHNILAARVLLHVREALQKDLDKTPMTSARFACGTNDTGTVDNY
jgi:hypothetical protein